MNIQKFQNILMRYLRFTPRLRTRRRQFRAIENSPINVTAISDGDGIACEAHHRFALLRRGGRKIRRCRARRRRGRRFFRRGAKAHALRRRKRRRFSRAPPSQRRSVISRCARSIPRRRSAVLSRKAPRARESPTSPRYAPEPRRRRGFSARSIS